MENYFKGKNEEELLEREKIPIPNLPPNFLWMQVSFFFSCMPYVELVVIKIN